MKEKLVNEFSVEKLVHLMFQSSKKAFDAVENALPEIGNLTNLIIDVIKEGGKVFYIGAGTSGRIGVLDASEIYPTFGEEDLFKAVIAGGKEAVFKAKEQIEDFDNQGKEDLESAGFTNKDIALGITASGKTPYVIGALKYAHSIGAKTGLVACNDVYYDFIDETVIAKTGDEFVKGSTRLNAGTAEKIILNIISTVSMVKLGRTYGNLMVSVVPTNNKLVKRATEIVSLITGVSVEEAEKITRDVKDARIASLMIKKGITKKEAEKLLKRHNFNFVEAFDG